MGRPIVAAAGFLAGLLFYEFLTQDTSRGIGPMKNRGGPPIFRPRILAKSDRGSNHLASMMKVGAMPAELENPLPPET